MVLSIISAFVTKFPSQCSSCAKFYGSLIADSGFWSIFLKIHILALNLLRK